MARVQNNLINVDKVKDFSNYLNGLPWTYEPSVAEVNALNKLKNTIEDYLTYLRETTLVKTSVCGHCGLTLQADGQCPGLCTPSERDK